MRLHAAVVITRFAVPVFVFVWYLAHQDKKWAETKARLSFEKCEILAWLPWFSGLVVLKHLATGEKEWLFIDHSHSLRKPLGSGALGKIVVLGQKAPPITQTAHRRCDELELVELTDMPGQSVF